jgi:hypothetical protein
MQNPLILFLGVTKVTHSTTHSALALLVTFTRRARVESCHMGDVENKGEGNVKIGKVFWSQPVKKRKKGFCSVKIGESLKSG